MNFDQIMKMWGAGELVETGVTFTRTFLDGNKEFSFRKEDIKSSTRMGLKALSHADAIGKFILEASSGKYTTDAQLMAAVIPDLCNKIGEDLFLDWIDSLVSKARFKSGNEYLLLSDDKVLSQAFQDDLTLQIAVAVTVLEVNCGKSFFDKLKDVYHSIKQESGENENSEQNQVEEI